MKVFIFNRLCPANELFSGLNSPCSRPSANAGKRCVTGKSHIFKMIANNLRISKVMKLIHKTVIKRFLICISDHFNPDRVKVGKIALNGFLTYLYFGNSFLTLLPSWTGEDNQADLFNARSKGLPGRPYL